MALVFTYNADTSLLLANYLENDVKSPKAGLSAVSLYKLASPSLHLNGVTLTVQFYNNTTPVTEDAITILRIVNGTIVASQGTNTIGTLTFTQQHQNPIPDGSERRDISLIPKQSTYVQSASGIFSRYLYGNVIRQYDIEGGNRIVTIFPPE
jgi:hypothetical protein